MSSPSLMPAELDQRLPEPLLRLLRALERLLVALSSMTPRATRKWPSVSVRRFELHDTGAPCTSAISFFTLPRWSVSVPVARFSHSSSSRRGGALGRASPTARLPPVVGRAPVGVDVGPRGRFAALTECRHVERALALRRGAPCIWNGLAKNCAPSLLLQPR